MPNTLAVAGKLSVSSNSSIVFNNPNISSTAGLNEIFLCDPQIQRSGLLKQINGNTLTITPNTLIHGIYGVIGRIDGVGTNTLINYGAINADQYNSAFYIEATNFINTGTLKARGGTIYVTDSVTNGTLSGNIDGNVYLSGNQALNGSLVCSGNVILDSTLDGRGNQLYGSLHVNGGTLRNTTGSSDIYLQGGTLQNITANSLLISKETNTLDNVTANGLGVFSPGDVNVLINVCVPNTLTASSLTVASDGSVNFNNPLGNSTIGTNQINLGEPEFYGSIGGANLTITPNTHIYGYFGYIDSDKLINQGTINGGLGGVTGIEVNGSISITNTGTLAASRTLLTINTVSFNNSGTLSATNFGSISIQGNDIFLASGNAVVGAGSNIFVTAGLILSVVKLLLHRRRSRVTAHNDILHNR